MQVGQMIRAEHYAEGTRLIRDGRKNHKTEDVNELLSLPRYGNPAGSDSGDDVDYEVQENDADHDLTAAPRPLMRPHKMTETAVAWCLQLTAGEAVQRAQDQRDDENGSEAEQDDVTNPPVAIDAISAIGSSIWCAEAVLQ